MNFFGRTLTYWPRAALGRTTTPVGNREPLSPATVRRGLTLSIIEGMFSQVHTSLTTGAILTGLALMLGAVNLALATLAALPLLLQPLQLFGAWLIERQGVRKSVTIGGSLGRTRGFPASCARIRPGRSRWALQHRFSAPMPLPSSIFRFKTLATFDGITADVSMIALPLWGRLADRVGHRRVLVIGLALVTPLPLQWIITTPNTIWIWYVNAALSGIGWPAVNLAFANQLMEQVPSEGRGAYLAVFATLTGIVSFLASTVAGGIADLIATLHWTIGPLVFNNYGLMFLLSCVLRGSVALRWRKAW